MTSPKLLNSSGSGVILDPAAALYTQQVEQARIRLRTMIQGERGDVCLEALGDLYCEVALRAKAPQAELQALLGFLLRTIETKFRFMTNLPPCPEVAAEPLPPASRPSGEEGATPTGSGETGPSTAPTGGTEQKDG